MVATSGQCIYISFNTTLQFKYESPEERDAWFESLKVMLKEIDDQNDLIAGFDVPHMLTKSQRQCHIFILDSDNGHGMIVIEFVDDPDYIDGIAPGMSAWLKST